MKSFFKFVPAALALMALASCSENDLLGESNVVEKVKGGLTVEVEQLGGDVTRQGNATYNGHAVVWQENDQINVYDNKLTMYDEYKFKADQKKFIGVNTSGTTNISTTEYALFPANQVDYAGWSSQGTKAVMRIPQLIIFDEESEFGSGTNYTYVSNLPMWGSATGTYPEAEVSLKYLTGVLRINLQNVFAEKATFLKIESQDDQPISGAFQAELSDKDGNVITDAKLEGGTSALSTANAIYVDLRNVPSYMTNIYVPIIARDYDYLKVGITKAVATEASPLKDNEEQIVSDLNGLTWNETPATGWQTLRNWDAGVTFSRAKMKSITEEAQYDLAGVTTCEMLSETFKQYANYKIGDANIADVLTLNIGGTNGLAVTRTGNENYKDDYTIYVPETEVDKIVVNIPAGIKAGAGTPKVDLQIVDADIKKPFKGELVINVQNAGITNNDLGNIIVNLPGAKFRLAGDFTVANALDKLQVKNVAELFIGDGATTTVLTTTNGITVNTAEKLHVTNLATVNNALDLVNTKDMKEVNINAGGVVAANLEVLKATVNVDGTESANTYVYGSAGIVNIGGNAGTMLNLATIGDVNIANTAENDAITGWLSVLGNNTITLKQGYVRAINYDETVGEFNDATGSGKYGKSTAGNYGKYYVKPLSQLTKSDKRSKLVTIKLDEIVGDGLTAIASIENDLLEYSDGTDVWNFAQLTESKWGGKAIAAAHQANYSSAAANDKIYTASELATIGANAAAGGTYFLYNNFDLDNKTWTCPAITINFDGRDPRLAATDEHSARIDEVVVNGFAGKVHYIKNLKFAPAANAANTGLFASITPAADATIQNVNIETVTTTTSGRNSKIGTVAGLADASAANITFTNIYVKSAALGGTTYTGSTPTFVGVREVGGLVGNATTAAGKTIAFTANKIETTSISGQGYLGGIAGAAIGAGTVTIQGNNVSLTSFTNAPQPSNYDMVNKNYGTIGMAIGQVDQPETAAADGTTVNVGIAPAAVNTFNDVIAGNRKTLGFPYNFVVGQYTNTRMAYVAGDELKYAFYGGDVLFGYSPNSATRINVRDAKSPAGASTNLNHDATKWVAADKTNFDNIAAKYKLNSYIQWTPYIEANPAY